MPYLAHSRTHRALIPSRFLRHLDYQDAPLASGAVCGPGAAGRGAVQAGWAGGGPTHSAWGTGQLPS